jgi:hypothetical protein
LDGQDVKTLLGLLVATLLVTGCEYIEKIDPRQNKEAEGKAIGGACRHAGRALEDCFKLYPEAVKSAVYDGWREMNDYMTEHKIETIEPVLPNSILNPPPEEKPAEPEVVEEVVEEAPRRSNRPITMQERP